MNQAQELRFEKKKPQSVLNLSAFVLGLIITLYNLTNLEYSQNLLSTEILRVNDLPTQILPKTVENVSPTFKWHRFYTNTYT